jgi:hypothetical protein
MSVSKEVSLRRTEPHLGPGASVEVDWFGELPAAHLHAFRAYEKEIETSYLILSVMLDEAISLRYSGSLTDSFRVLILVSTLCGRLTILLEDILGPLAAHSKAHGTIPSVAAFSPADFKSARGQRRALKSLLLHQALGSQQAQFHSKIHALRGMIAHIGNNFRTAADDLASREAITYTTRLWASLEAGHFDLNTCLRESVISLKCFLRVLPDDQLRLFQRNVSRHKTMPNAEPIIADATRAVDREMARLRPKPFEGASITLN